MTRIGIAGYKGRQGARWIGEVAYADHTVVPFERDKTSIPEWLAGCQRVIVAAPTRYHVAITQAALRAGKPVLCEKPLAESFQDAASLYEVAQRYWTRLWVAYPHLWHPSVEAMAKLPGKIDVEVTFCGPTNAEPVLDWAPHALSAALYILGFDAQLVTWTANEAKTKVQMVLASERGRAWLEFGQSPVKRTRIQTKSPSRLYYTGENTHPTTMQRMLQAWLGEQQDPRADPALTLGVHELLDEVLK